MDRTYLYVPPEEKAEVKAAGAHWDDRLKCWYILGDEDPAKFAKCHNHSQTASDQTLQSSPRGFRCYAQMVRDLLHRRATFAAFLQKGEGGLFASAQGASRL